METVQEFWFINMAERSERRQRVEVRSEKIGLQLKRYNAVTPWSDERVEIMKNGRGKDKVPGAIGCGLSHYDLWCLSAEKEIRLYIQEDDLIYRKDFRSLVDRTIKNLDAKHGSDGWDVLHLNPYLNLPLDGPMEDRLIPLTGTTWSLGAYILNPKAAELLVDYYCFPKKEETKDILPWGPELTIPDLMISWLFSYRPEKSFTLYPYPSIQDKLGSDVQIEHCNMEHDHDYYYNKYGGKFKDLYDWTATEASYDSPIDHLVKK